MKTEPHDHTRGVEVELEIVRLGAQGDGVAEGAGAPVFVPYTLAGERVRAVIDDGRVRLVQVVEAAPERVAAVCRHFGTCGGCAMQHMAPSAYAAWKRGLIVDALAQRGISAEVKDAIIVGPASRRRAVLSAVATRGGAVLGFHAARGDTVIDVIECPMLEPRIVAALPGLRPLLARLPRWEGEARVSVVAVEGGLDVDVAGAVGKAGIGAQESVQIAKVASDIGDLLRLGLDGTAVYQRARPLLRMGAAAVEPPAGAFLQASSAAERAMAELVCAALPKRARTGADLFCGVGAFTFPLAERVAVTAVDNGRQALDALAAAARSTQGLKPIRTLNRDLFREPLSRKELEGFDMVVFDPPRAGAASQAAMLAKSKVPVVVAVSCNPATMARDIRTLIDGGYTLGPVTPIDQFHWSAHVEAVAVLRR